MRKDKHAETGQTKSVIPLLKGVREALLRAQNVFGQGPNLIPAKRAASISDKFAKMTKKLGIEDFSCFHTRLLLSVLPHESTGPRPA